MSKLALLGGEPTRKKPFPKWPMATKEEKKYLKEVIDGNGWGFFRTDKIDLFEKKFAQYHGAKYGIACSNATAALQLQLMALGIGRGDEVITTVFTCVSTATAIMSVGAIPVFVDIQESDYCIDPKKIESKITVRTKAIMPVHLYCSVAEIDEIAKIAKKHKLLLIEDAAQVPGTFYKGKGIGTFGISSSFSFQESKVMTSAEGGIILTNDDKVNQLTRMYANCGRRREGDTARGVLGNNFRMTAFQAAVLLGQLELLQERTEKRQQNAAYLDSKLSSIDGIELIERNLKADRQTYYIYTFKYTGANKFGVSRAVFLKAMEAEGIQMKNLFVPLYKDPLFNINEYDTPETWRYYKNNPSNAIDFPVAEKAAYDQGVGIRHAIFIKEEKDMDDIANAVAKIISNISDLTAYND